jgi:hypothetical protein
MDALVNKDHRLSLGLLSICVNLLLGVYVSLRVYFRSA